MLSIEQLVDSIYDVDQIDLDKKFIEFLDSMENYILYIEKENQDFSMNQELLMLQEAYLKRDYIQLSDIILYDIKEKL